MGWTKLGIYASPLNIDDDALLKKGAEGEMANSTPNANSEYPYCVQGLSVIDLPFIPPEIIRRYNGKTALRMWIVIDDIVYDCSEFLAEHPGSEAVIRNLSGSECSWQFWRLHSGKHLREYGLPLRVGKTKGVENHYIEPKKYVGLRTIGDDFS